MFWWIVATLCAFFVKGLCGFANTLVFSTILSFGNSSINITPVELLLGYPTNAILAWKERKSINWGMSIPLAILVLAGSIPGAYFLKTVHEEVVKTVLGFVIVFIGLEMLLRDRQSGNTFRVLMYIFCGIITLETAKQTLLLVPWMFIGLSTGMASSRGLNEKIVKKLVIVMLIVSGVALIINNL